MTCLEQAANKFIICDARMTGQKELEQQLAAAWAKAAEREAAPSPTGFMCRAREWRLEPGFGSKGRQAGCRRLSFQCSRDQSYSLWFLASRLPRHLEALSWALSRLSWKLRTSSCAPAGPERSSWKAGLRIDFCQH